MLDVPPMPKQTKPNPLPFAVMIDREEQAPKLARIEIVVRHTGEPFVSRSGSCYVPLPVTEERVEALRDWIQELIANAR